MGAESKKVCSSKKEFLKELYASAEQVREKETLTNAEDLLSELILLRIKNNGISFTFISKINLLEDIYNNSGIKITGLNEFNWVRYNEFFHNSNERALEWLKSRRIVYLSNDGSLFIMAPGARLAEFIADKKRFFSWLDTIYEKIKAEHPNSIKQLDSNIEKLKKYQKIFGHSVKNQQIKSVMRKQ